MDPPAFIIRDVRTCPEHLARLFTTYFGPNPWPEALQEHARAKGYRHTVVVKLKAAPVVDERGNLLIQNEIHYVRDDRYPSNDPRHVVLTAHCATTAEGVIGYSGKLDPKSILIGDRRHIGLTFTDPKCEVCVDGDMIPPTERFRSSTYKP